MKLSYKFLVNCLVKYKGKEKINYYGKKINIKNRIFYVLGIDKRSIIFKYGVAFFKCPAKDFVRVEEKTIYIEVK